MKVRRLPLVLEAFCWLQHSTKAVDSMEETPLPHPLAAPPGMPPHPLDLVRRFEPTSQRVSLVPCALCFRQLPEHGYIDTLVGRASVCPGDWLIMGVDGQPYPLRNAVFVKTYEPVSP